jgi:transposase-like protein
VTTSAVPSYAGYRFPAEVLSHAVWLYFRFPLSPRMVDELLAVCGIVVSHETVRQWALRFGQSFANQIRRREAQGAEQQGGKLPPAHTTARAADEAVQVTRARSALPLRP